jgi:hypothetical protein
MTACDGRRPEIAYQEVLSRTYRMDSEAGSEALKPWGRVSIINYSKERCAWHTLRDWTLGAAAGIMGRVMFHTEQVDLDVREARGLIGHL